MRNTKVLSGLSLFSGAGGMDIGFIDAGIDVVGANDIDRDACLTYEANHPGRSIEQGDINSKTDYIKKFDGVDIVFGGPPCQGFSIAGKMNPADMRSQLLWSFVNAVDLTRPKAFVCENVKALATLDKWSEVRQRLFYLVDKLGYSCKLVVLNAADFGVAQTRERMFLIGFQKMEGLENLESLFEMRRKPSPVVRDILLPLGLAGSVNNQRVCNAKVSIATRPVLRKSPYAGMLFNGQGRPLNPNGYSCALHASMGGNKTPIIDENHCYFGEESWVEWYHAHLLSGKPSLPADSAPSRLRRLTVDEALRIQSFPDNYKFIGKQSSVLKQIGNAVPCELAKVVAEVVRNCLVAEKATNLKSSMIKQLHLAV